MPSSGDVASKNISPTECAEALLRIDEMTWEIADNPKRYTQEEINEAMKNLQRKCRIPDEHMQTIRTYFEKGRERSKHGFMDEMNWNFNRATGVANRSALTNMTQPYRILWISKDGEQIIGNESFKSKEEAETFAGTEMMEIETADVDDYAVVQITQEDLCPSCGHKLDWIDQDIDGDIHYECPECHSKMTVYPEGYPFTSYED